jgi:hypothetical protein
MMDRDTQYFPASLQSETKHQVKAAGRGTGVVKTFRDQVKIQKY